MNEDLSGAYVAELASASKARAGGDIEAAFQHLGRAHIISQRFTWQHAYDSCAERYPTLKDAIAELKAS